jgi:PiT family inorganic phosphate transporter
LLHKSVGQRARSEEPVQKRLNPPEADKLRRKFFVRLSVGDNVEQLLIKFGIVLAFFFCFASGVHDGGNLVAATVLSRSIAPRRALLFAAAAVFCGPLLYGSAVAYTLREVFLDKAMILSPNRTVLCLFLVSGVASATLWNMMTWWVGRPSGSSYTLLGGLLGGGIAAFGFEAIHGWPLLCKVLLFLLLAPVLGALLAHVTVSTVQLFENSGNPSHLTGEVCPSLAAPEATRVKGGGGKKAGCRDSGSPWIWLQGLSLLFEGLGHGANSAQKSAAVILMLLLPLGSVKSGQLPFWAVLGCSISLSAGVPIGGWKIATILSGKSSRIESIHSLSSQLAAGVVLAGANLLGGVLSPNQLVKASVLGTGAGGRKGTPWRILANNLIMGWFIHLPACALIAAAIHWCAGGALGLGMGSLEIIMGVLGP